MFKTWLIKIAHKILRSYWRIRKPVTTGARGIVLSNDKTQVFLVKHTTSKQWYLPGGGVKKSEAPAVALQRELQEEVGLHIKVEQLKNFSIYENNQEGKKDTVHVFLVELLDRETTQTKDVEIERGYWYPLDQLPSDISPGTQRRLKEYLGEKAVDARW